MDKSVFIAQNIVPPPPLEQVQDEGSLHVKSTLAGSGHMTIENTAHISKLDIKEEIRNPEMKKLKNLRMKNFKIHK